MLGKLRNAIPVVLTRAATVEDPYDFSAPAVGDAGVHRGHRHGRCAKRRECRAVERCRRGERVGVEQQVDAVDPRQAARRVARGDGHQLHASD